MGRKFFRRHGDRLPGDLTAEAGPSLRAASPRDFSDPYRSEGPAGLLIANLLSESQDEHDEHHTRGPQTLPGRQEKSDRSRYSTSAELRNHPIRSGSGR